jgi:hypothetical protein
MVVPDIIALMQHHHADVPLRRREDNMNDTDNHVAGSDLSASTSNRVGFYSALLTTIITIITFGLAMTAIPVSGANCPGDCVEYPYLDTVRQYPRDYLWMYAAILMILAYVVLMVSIHAYAAPGKRIFSQIGLSFAVISAVVLLSTYFVQFSVVPVSLKNEEMEGVALLIQYNPHGVFIALEELGYLMMSLSFFFMAPVFAKRSRLESAVRWVFVIGLILTVVSLAVISIGYGLEKLDRFEVVAISVDWLVLIVGGVLLSVVFRRQLKAERKS